MGLNWAHFLSLRVAVDQVISANQRTQGNKGQKGISLVYWYSVIGVSTSIKEYFH